MCFPSSCAHTVSLTTVHTDGPGAESYILSADGNSSVPMFLDSVECSGLEASLLDCRVFPVVGLVSCGGPSTTAVRCLGKLWLLVQH